MQNRTLPTQHAPPPKVGQGHLLAAFKSGHRSDPAGARHERPQSNASPSVDKEIEDCLQLAAALDDDTWDGLDEELRPDQHERRAPDFAAESPPKRRKVPDGPQGSIRFRPYVAGQAASTAPAAPAAPAAAISRGRFEIPDDEREGLNLAEAQSAKLFRSPQLGPLRSGGGMVSSDTIEESPSSETAYTHNKPSKRVGSGHHHHSRPLDLVYSETGAYMPIIAASSPQTPPKHQFPRTSHGYHPGLAIDFSSPLAQVSPTTRGLKRSSGATADLLSPQQANQFQPAFADVQTSIQVALGQSLQRAQQEWDKERRAFQRKLDAKDKTIKCLRDRLAASNCASSPSRT